MNPLLTAALELMFSSDLVILHNFKHYLNRVLIVRGENF
jgi:hypothetical protein